MLTNYSSRVFEGTLVLLGVEVPYIPTSLTRVGTGPLREQPNTKAVGKTARRKKKSLVYAIFPYRGDLEPLSLLGDNSVQFQVIWPQNGTAVLKCSRVR